MPGSITGPGNFGLPTTWSIGNFGILPLGFFVISPSLPGNFGFLVILSFRFDPLLPGNLGLHWSLNLPDLSRSGIRVVLLRSPLGNFLSDEPPRFLLRLLPPKLPLFKFFRFWEPPKSLPPLEFF